MVRGRGKADPSSFMECHVQANVISQQCSLCRLYVPDGVLTAPPLLGLFLLAISGLGLHSGCILGLGPARRDSEGESFCFSLLT